jgi:hypoxanthine-DNA glycosylase
MPDTGFPYSADHDAKVLILGSMPSCKSLARQQYYAHPRNTFWPIMAALFEFNSTLKYSEHLRQLRINKVALWDVAHRCVRPGSLDHAIEMETVVPNDFISFFEQHRDIHVIFFNGQKAAELYRRLVLPELASPGCGLPRHILPSTSPAHAALSQTEKLKVWKIIRQTLEMS